MRHTSTRRRIEIAGIVTLASVLGACSLTGEGVDVDGSRDASGTEGGSSDGGDAHADVRGDVAPFDVATDVPIGLDVAMDTVGTDGISTDSTPSDASDASSVDAVDAVGAVDVPPVDTGCSAPTSCYSGASGTSGVGACHAGSEQCIAGGYGPCIGEVDPTPEACNGVDDDCNGMTDEGLGHISCGVGACLRTVAACVSGRVGTCMPGTPSSEVCGDGIDNNCNGAIDEGCNCVHVALTGSDSAGTGSASAPFRTIMHAITVAGTTSGTSIFPSVVCVASGATCPSTANYPETIVMRNGIDVYGGYQASGSAWPRMAGCVTAIDDQTAQGVSFDATITSTTILDGFTVDAIAMSGSTLTMSAAISVVGSTGAQISNDVVAGGNAATTYGIDVTAGSVPATPRITLDTIVGGNGTALSAGVHSNGSAPIIAGNCGTYDSSGRCTNGCYTAGVPSIRALAGSASAGGVDGYAILLESSPGTLVDTSSICGSLASGDAAGVRITGDASGIVIHANQIAASHGGVNSVGVWMDACAGAAPWIFDNVSIAGGSPVAGARGDGVRAVGDCNPIIDSNALIVGGQESAMNIANGVYCAVDPTSGVSSRCVVVDNALIEGSGSGFPPSATGVRCDDGACATIENNANITGNSAVLSYGVVLGNSGTFVSANHINAGCGTMETDGLVATNSFARVQNNIITGGACNGVSASIALTFGVKVLSAGGTNEIDLHSNDILAGGGISCTGHALAFDVAPGGTPPSGLRGLVRNDILQPGSCSTRDDLDVINAAAGPRDLENNDFFFHTAGDVLYRPASGAPLTTAAAINALTGFTVAANISADPLWTAVDQLMSGSPCIDTGTAVGAPATDIVGTARPVGAGYDIGAYEFHP